MKHFFLPVLMWALAISPSFAQKPLPPSAVLQLENGTLPLAKMLRDAGYAFEAISAPQAVLSRSNPLQLDSTKTFFGYQLNGNLDSTPAIRSTFQYPQTGSVVQTESQFVGGAWIPLTRLTTTLDAQDRILERLGEEYDAATQTFQPGSKIQMFPRGNSPVLIDSVKAFLWDEDLGAWAFAFQLTNTFNAQDRITSAITSFEADGEVTSFLDEYSYNGNGDNHLIESFVQSNGVTIPTGKQEMMYLNHLLIQVIDFQANGLGTFVPTNRNTYAYNPSKLLSQQNIYTWVPGVNDWNPVQNLVFQYDNAQRLVVKETEFIQDAHKERATYAYVEDENLSLEGRYVWDNALNAYLLADRKYYYYSGGTSAVLPTPLAVRTLLLSPNPTSGVVRFPMDTEAAVRVFDAAGQMVQSLKMQPGEALNLSVLPAGIYHLTARSSTDFFSGKVVKQ